MRELRCHDAVPFRRRAARSAIVVDPAVAAMAFLGLVLTILLVVPAPPDRDGAASYPRTEALAHSFP